MEMEENNKEPGQERKEEKNLANKKLKNRTTETW
jgi:hypothetical protein